MDTASKKFFPFPAVKKVLHLKKAEVSEKENAHARNGKYLKNGYSVREEGAFILKNKFKTKYSLSEKGATREELKFLLAKKLGDDNEKKSFDFKPFFKRENRLFNKETSLSGQSGRMFFSKADERKELAETDGFIEKRDATAKRNLKNILKNAAVSDKRNKTADKGKDLNGSYAVMSETKRRRFSFSDVENLGNKEAEQKKKRQKKVGMSKIFQNNRRDFPSIALHCEEKGRSLKKETFSQEMEGKRGPAGLSARSAALKALLGIKEHGLTAEASFRNVFRNISLSERDKGFVRLLVLTTLRYEGILDAVVGAFLSKPLPSKQKRVKDILRLGAAQLLLLKTPPHAVLWTSVELVKEEKKAAFLSGLVNAVLRRVGKNGEALLTEKRKQGRNVPAWLLESWKEAYGEEASLRIADSLLEEPLLYLTVKEPNRLSFWAERVGGEVVSPESVLCRKTGDVSQLDGYDEGGWWVQDKAASLPVLVLKEAFGGSLEGKKIADLCAAPGGKTAQLLCMGARVDAFDISESRLKRFEENMDRLHLEGYEARRADACLIEGEEVYDGVLLDAPCSATGTLRRHPEILTRLSPEDVGRLALMQKKMLLSAARLVKTGGFVLYSTCSLQKEEGEEIVRSCPSLVRQEILSSSFKDFLTEEKNIRTFPYNNTDGFFICLLKKKN